MKQERLFNAIGGADIGLLERSEKIPHTKKTTIWIRRGLPAAACFAVILSILLMRQNSGTVSTDTAIPPENNHFTNGAELSEAGEGGFHLLQLSYATEPNDNETADFIIYVNETLYGSREQDGAYVIEPIAPVSADLPECSLKITQTGNISTAQAAEQMMFELQKTYADVSAPVSSSLVNGLYIHGNNGTDWNAKQLDVYFVDDRQGGIFVITASYFTEAAEGHGARFSDMIGTFQVVTASEEAESAAWLSQLKNTAAAVIPAIFSDEPADASAYLTNDALISTYGKNVSDDVSVQAIDYSVDNDKTPANAVISVRHRLGTEDSYSYLTVELSYKNGQWFVYFAGIEK